MSFHPFNPNDGKVEKHNQFVGKILEVNKEIVESERARLMMHARLFNFTIDSARLKKAHEDFLRDELAPMLKKDRRLVAVLVGAATKDKAGDDYNQKKGRQRAGEVHGFLVVKQGVDAGQLRIREKGEVRGAMGAQRDEDRAVDVLVIEPASKFFSIRLIDPIVVWQRLGFAPKANMDQIAFMIEDKLNGLKSIYFFAEDRPDEVRRIVILANMPNDPGFNNSETAFVTAEAATSTDFQGARVIISPPNAGALKPGDPEVMNATITGERVGGIFTSLKASAVSWPIGIDAISGRCARAVIGQQPVAPPPPTTNVARFEERVLASPPVAMRRV